MTDKKFALTQFPTPVLNTPDFDKIFCGHALPLDDQGLLRPVETVLFPGTKVQILSTHPRHIVRVKIPRDYPYGENLYVDERFLTPAEEKSSERPLKMPSPQAILSRMKTLIGTRYIWGGNTLGVPQLLDFYPPARPLQEMDSLIRETWALQGVDCSGLLYLATHGCTPRNTGQLVHFGTCLPLAGKTPKQIATALKPLDALVWKGHILFAFDQTHAIESRAGFGVVVTKLETRMKEILQERPLQNAWTPEAPPHFVIRRWIYTETT